MKEHQKLTKPHTYKPPIYKPPIYKPTIKWIIRKHIQSRVSKIKLSIRFLKMRVRFFFASPKTQQFVLNTLKKASDDYDKKKGESHHDKASTPQRSKRTEKR